MNALAAQGVSMAPAILSLPCTCPSFFVARSALAASFFLCVLCHYLYKIERIHLQRKGVSVEPAVLSIPCTWPAFWKRGPRSVLGFIFSRAHSATISTKEKNRSRCNGVLIAPDVISVPCTYSEGLLQRDLSRPF